MRKNPFYDIRNTHLHPLPRQPYDTSYREWRRVAPDAYIEVRGNRYSVPASLVGQLVALRIGLDDSVRVYHAETLVASHRLRSTQEGWSTMPEHHAALWQETVPVAQRSLQAYEEAAQWS